MRPKCELMVKRILPAVRVAVVKKLAEKHRMKQTEIAERLGITQPAVSQYLNRLRGSRYQSVLRRYGIMSVIDELVEQIVAEERRDEEFSQIYCHICAELSKKGALK